MAQFFRTRFVGLRISPEEFQKLQTLAAQSERTMSQVLRLLLQQARVSHVADIYLASGLRTSPHATS
jgi:predicted DNA-binding protein